jgi:hypothetical protein
MQKNPNPFYGKDKYEREVIQKIKELGQYMGSWIIARILRQENIRNRRGNFFSHRQINRYLPRDFSFIDKELNERVKTRIKNATHIRNLQGNGKEMDRRILKTFWCPLLKPTGMFFSDPVACFTVQQREIAKHSKECPCFVGIALREMFPKKYKEYQKTKKQMRSQRINFGTLQG